MAWQISDAVGTADPRADAIDAADTGGAAAGAGVAEADARAEPAAAGVEPAATGVETADAGGEAVAAGLVAGGGSLVARAQQGDGEAFRALYRDTQPRLLRYLRALAGADAEDVASEAWLQIARDLPGFSGDLDQFRGWAAAVARHRALDHLRRQARRPAAVLVPSDDLAGLAAGDDTAERALDAVATRAAVGLIATLPPDQAEAVLLRVVVGLDAVAAAAVLGKRPGAVRTAAYRGLRTLARRVELARPPPSARE
jgi:RNA polymerase sigma-70 factor, ECF subfamily